MRDCIFSTVENGTTNLQNNGVFNSYYTDFTTRGKLNVAVNGYTKIYYTNFYVYDKVALVNSGTLALNFAKIRTYSSSEGSGVFSTQNNGALLINRSPIEQTTIAELTGWTELKRLTKLTVDRLKSTTSLGT